MGKSRKSTIRKFEFYETITDNGIESGYVRLANTQFHSDAVMDLSANSYRVFTYMKFRAKGNKVFTYTYENAIKDASISRQTFLKVKKELIDNGLIKQLASNAYSPSKFEFRITIAKGEIGLQMNVSVKMLRAKESNHKENNGKQIKEFYESKN